MTTVFDLFSGIGGFREGLARVLPAVTFSGWCERDTYASTAYSAMYQPEGEAHVRDLLEITRTPSGALASLRAVRRRLPEFDCLTAGMPCQPHSLMGNRRGHDDERGALVYDTLRVIDAVRPKLVVLENVRGFRSVNEGALYETLVRDLRRMRYDVRTWVLDASHHDVPQVRRRLFVVASTLRLPEQPPPEKRLTISAWHVLERKVEAKYYLSERILTTIMKHTHKGYSRKAEINRLVARPLTRTMHKMHRASQDNYYSDDFVCGEYDAATAAVVLNPLAGTRIRRITPREALRLQGFPEHLLAKALNAGLSDSRLYMLAGNAVPPNLAEAVVAHALGGRKLDVSVA